MEKFENSIMYFIGVTTHQSIINYIFPKWMEYLGYNVQLIGIDIPLNASADIYYEYAEKIKKNDNVLGALVTTHKIAMYSAARDIFDVLTDSAQEFKEIGAIYKKSNEMNGEATDIISVNKAFADIYEKVNIDNSDMCILGCGGAGVALGYVVLKYYNANFEKIIMTDTNVSRLEQAKEILSVYDLNEQLRLVHVCDARGNDNVIDNLSSKSFIVNATGVGKDIQGSPISNDAKFPSESCIWEFNYRGNLGFMNTAKEQAIDRKLSVHDGFNYFIYGWTTVISRVLDIDISKDTFSALSEIALETMYS